MRKYMKILALALTMVMMLSSFTFAATEEEIELSTEPAMAWLATQQFPDGHWGIYEEAAHTGLALLKFETHAFNLGLDPLSSEYIYSDVVAKGLDYIFNHSFYTPCGIMSVHDQYDYTDVHHANYNTACALMAIAASGNPDLVIPDGTPLTDGMTYKEVAEGMVEYFVNGQIISGPNQGGWGYNCENAPDGWADNSNSGYVVLALEYARSSYYGFNISPPADLINRLKVWIGNIQNPSTGGSYYTPGGGWENILKTGNLIQQMNFVGMGVNEPEVQKALDFIVNNFYGAGDPSWHIGSMVHKQATFAMMKGLESYGIEILDPGGADIDWFDEVSTALIAEQDPAGYWATDYWAGGNRVLSTTWAILTLQKVSPPLTVEIDIKPGSDPNGINLRNKGVIPVAILTTDVFDATTVDPATVMFAGAYPLRWSIEDVDFDGDLDMLFFFKTQDTNIMPGDTEAELTGETLSGKEFSGVDSVKTVPTE